MANRRAIYREVQYVVGMRPDRYRRDISFFPLVVIDGQQAAQTAEHNQSCWSANLGDVIEMSLAYGAAQALCDQSNASLQEKGLNRLREVS